MAGYTAGSHELRQAGREMEDANVQLMERMKALAAAVDSVQWKGQAHTAFVQLMGAFQSDAQRLNDSLVRIAEEISASATEYDRQEQQAQESLSGITAALDGI
ncbi:MAG TPA: WXG100 family type VII secretion target [Actinophytocola sp.]|uniref:WXG100 family type VII secretion target n=1 Tax=Actinophytocola sp. TaxID=1872138 RepID=UPI002DDD9E5E|nr:WXG100 family type VII secretion target [Actinophytocola sp.]HEV2780701.1 WXG100 family type VII secretion target [Actinophytocola sp.]